MCDICDGQTDEQLLRKIHDHIGGGRWVLQGVDNSRSGWLYTVGLSHNFDHAELVLVDADLERDAALLNELGARISRGLRIDPSTTVDLGDGYVIEFERVHDSYLARGLCASWNNYNDWVGSRPSPLEVLQVVKPLSEWCAHCDARRRCLAAPGVLGFDDSPNHAARRSQPHRPRRR